MRTNVLLAAISIVCVFGCAAKQPALSMADRQELHQYVQGGFELGLLGADCRSVAVKIIDQAGQQQQQLGITTRNDIWVRTVQNALESGCRAGVQYRRTGDKKYLEVKVDIEGGEP